MNQDTRPPKDDHDDALLEALGKQSQNERMSDALRPLGRDFQARMVDQIQAELGGQAPQNNASDAAASGDNVVELAARRRSPWVTALAASAVAAVGLAFVLGPMQSGPALPDYTLEFQGGAVVRGEDQLAPLQFGDTLRAVVRPDTDLGGAATLQVFRVDGETLRAVPADVQWADSGAARISVTLTETLGLTAGPQDWWFVVSHEADAPGVDELARLSAPVRDTNWQILRQRFELEP